MSNKQLPGHIVIIHGQMGYIEQAWKCKNVKRTAIYCSTNTNCEKCVFKNINEKNEEED